MIKLRDVYEGGKVATGAIDFLFQIIDQRMTEPEVNITATMPTIEQHRQFVHRRPYRAWFLVENEEGIRVGYVSATPRNEIGVVILKEHRGCGYGPQAVKALTEQLEPLPAIPSERVGRWLANINPENERSRRMFERLGYRLKQVTYEL